MVSMSYWMINDYVTRYTLNGDSGTLYITALGVFVGGIPDKTFSTADGLQLDAGTPPDIEIEDIDIVFSPDRSVVDYSINFNCLSQKEKTKMMDLIKDVVLKNS